MQATLSSIRRLDSSNRNAVAQFARMDAIVHRNDPHHVALQQAEVRKRLGTQTTLLHSSVESALFVADSGQARAAAMINHGWQAYHGDGAGFIGYLAGNDASAVAGVIRSAEHWLRERGCDRAIVGVDGSYLAGIGVRTAGFDQTPLFPTQWHPSSYARMLEMNGYEPTYPFWHYRIDFANPTFTLRAMRSLQGAACTLRPINKSHWTEEIERFAKIADASYVDGWEHHPVGADTWLEVLQPLRPLLKPWQLLFAEVDGVPVGAVLAMADLSPMLQQAHGRSDRMTRFAQMRSARHADDCGIVLMAVLPQARGRGIANAMTAQVLRNFLNAGFRHGWIYPVRDDDDASRTLAESFGGVGQNLTTCFDKPLY